MQNNQQSSDKQATTASQDMDTSSIQQEAANEPVERGTTEPEGGSFEDIEKEEGLANDDAESDGPENEAYINTDLVSENDIKEARESLMDEERMPESPLSDPTQTDNN